MFLRSLLAVSSVVLITGVGGCATWNAPAPSVELPVSRMSPDSVVLEIVFVRVPADAIESLEEMWNGVDELHLSNEQRRRLAANGIRTGIVGTHVPEFMRQLLNQEADPTELARAGGPVGDDIFRRQRRLPSRAGQQAKILAGPAIHERMVVVFNDDGLIRGEDFEHAQAVFSLTTNPLGDGRVKLKLVPTIEHGEFRQRITGGDNRFLFQAQRDIKVFDDLQIETLLSPGQILALSCTTDAKGLGEQFFSLASKLPAERSIMMIRLSQTQFDDLFAETPAGD